MIEKTIFQLQTVRSADDPQERRKQKLVEIAKKENQIEKAQLP